ncbi:MAG: ATP-binding protein [Anaerolineales bacterium]|jgi:hypothetical protein|nr:ATP-binding protein [Anaerolineales bacterium]MDX9936065.1 hypothetical protein [Anaerolineales bacterium]GER79435.1 conserved hypothetical protein [Candidatus Denitrolinea symbiosum]
MFSCDEYDQDVFVDRPAALAKIRNWADDDTAQKRVMQVIAPPGGGKTWLLKKLEKEWESRFVIFINIPSLVHLDEREDLNRLINSEACEAWFQNIQEAATSRYSITPISEIPNISAILSAFVKQICYKRPNKAVIVLADGYDELTESQADVFSARILQPLYERDCIRLIIAHRPERLVKGDAIRRDLPNPPLYLHQFDPPSRDFAFEQFENLIRKSGSRSTTDPSKWMNELQHYQWNHPLANCFFFKRGLETNWKQLTDADFQECCKVIIERSNGNGRSRFSLRPDGFKTLHYIAKELPDQWSQTDVEALLKINNFYLDEIVQNLFDVGSIINVSPVPPFYQICDGLRELLREIK